jgi:hypothetical protein
MKRFKKLALTVAALAALAVGGAAFAQAQNAGTVANTQVQTRSVETGTPGDPADVSGAADQGQAGEESGTEQAEKADQADSPGEKDSPDGPNDQQGPDDQGGQSD